MHDVSPIIWKRTRMAGISAGNGDLLHRGAHLLDLLLQRHILHLQHRHAHTSRVLLLRPAIGKPCMTESYLHLTMRVFTYPGAPAGVRGGETARARAPRLPSESTEARTSAPPPFCGGSCSCWRSVSICTTRTDCHTRIRQRVRMETVCRSQSRMVFG